jgi:hypothetical protein
MESETATAPETTTESATYRVFTRTWWRRNPKWPSGREPGAGKPSYRGHPRGLSYDEARRYCRRWNETHPAGPLSRKAELESE